MASHPYIPSGAPSVFPWLPQHSIGFTYDSLGFPLIPSGVLQLPSSKDSFGTPSGIPTSLLLNKRTMTTTKIFLAINMRPQVKRPYKSKWFKIYLLNFA